MERVDGLVAAASRIAGSCVLLAMVLGAPGPPCAEGAATAEGQSARLVAVRGQIEAVRAELGRMAGREQGLLGELERLGAELRLREAERAEVATRLAEVTAAIERRDAVLERLDGAQVERRRYLEFRLREIYKAGEHGALRRLLGSAESAEAWTAASYAGYLNQRDAEVLEAFRADEQRSAAERGALESERRELERVEAELGVAEERLERSRQSQRAALDRLRDDQRARRTALDELEASALELERVVERHAGGEAPPVQLDVRRFRGLLDWPG
jgi:septal ring factor EnvC (AmiA/AmiB activator)